MNLTLGSVVPLAMFLQSKPFEQMLCQNSEEITPKTHFNWNVLSSQLNHSEMSPKLCLQILTLFLSPEEKVGPHGMAGFLVGRIAPSRWIAFGQHHNARPTSLDPFLDAKHAIIVIFLTM